MFDKFLKKLLHADIVGRVFSHTANVILLKESSYFHLASYRFKVAFTINNFFQKILENSLT